MTSRLAVALRAGSLRPVPRRCRVCASTWPGHARFCGRCGAVLAAPPDATRRTASPAGRRRRRRSRTTPMVALLAATVVLAGVLIVTAEPLGPDVGMGLVDVDRTAAAAPDSAGMSDDGAGVDAAGRQPGDPGWIASGRDWPVCRRDSDVVDCVRWRWPLPAADPALVTVTGPHVAAVGHDGTIRLVSLATGQERWAVRLDTAAARAFLPVVADTLPVAAGGTTHFLDLTSGRPVGEVVAPDPVAAVAVPGWLLTAGRDRVGAWAVNGHVTWERELAETETVLLTRAGAVVAAEDGTVTRLTNVTGTPRWVTVLDGPVTHAAAAGDAVVVGVAADQPSLVRLGTAGQAEWELDLHGHLRWLTISDDGATLAAILAADGGQRLLVADARSGEVRHRERLAQGASGALPPVIGGDIVAVAHAGPSPWLTVVTGAGTRLRASLQRIPHDVVILGGGGVAVSDGGGVTVWSLMDGRRLWHAQLGPQGRVVSGSPLVVAGSRGLAAFDVELPESGPPTSGTLDRR